MSDLKPLFTCKTCGAHDLKVTHAYDLAQRQAVTIACECGEAVGGLASEREEFWTDSYTQVGLLDAEHRVTDWEEAEKQEDGEVEYGEWEIHCHDCHEAAVEDEDAIQTEPIEPDDDDLETVEFTVICGGCEREIEFGWSHPDRGGRIWPAECSDFNPWKSWPEPKYKESWRAKGWLRPDLA